MMLESLWPHCLSRKMERRLYIIYQKKLKNLETAGFSLRSDYIETRKEFLCSLLTIAYIMSDKLTLENFRKAFKITVMREGENFLGCQQQREGRVCPILGGGGAGPGRAGPGRAGPSCPLVLASLS